MIKNAYRFKLLNNLDIIERKQMLQKIFILTLIGLASQCLSQEDLYFPPNNSDEWETISLEDAGWCTDNYDALLTELNDNQSKAFIVLKDGKIIIEEYLNDFKRDSSWIWFSAGKSLSSFLVGMAQEQGFLDINSPSSTYLGKQWTSLPEAQENNITVRHQLTMTTGLDYTVMDAFCTDPECLSYLNEPGQHWYYHNAPYSLLRPVIENATGKNLNIYTVQQMHQKIGMDGLWVPVGFNNFFISTARSMARFGLLMLGKGDWNGNTIMSDKAYLEAMTNSSQDKNPSYGYLWWLNGKAKHKLPSTDEIFDGPIVPMAPPDMYCAIGASGQILCVIPSQNIVIVRMGSSDFTDFVPVTILENISEKLSDVICEETSSATHDQNDHKILIYPNPMVGDQLFLDVPDELPIKYALTNVLGKVIHQGNVPPTKVINLPIPNGFYGLMLYQNDKLIQTEKLVKH
jgi:CubicO group peptidase (beta-lactamase class C family)